MKVYRYSVPSTLGMPAILDICRKLAQFPKADSYELDFSETNHFEPFGMLMLASAIRRLKKHVGQDRVLVRGKDNRQGHDYARYLGFWRSIGCEASMPTAMKAANETTIPVTRLSYKDMFQNAGMRDPIRSEDVEKASRDIAATLARGVGDSELEDTLTYCFREVIRNAFEHGQTDAVWYTAATRRSKDDIQVAILDEGVGIRASLKRNPAEVHERDEDAICAALRPGVSRNTGRGRSIEATQKLMEEFPGQSPSLYDNSGYGLSVTSFIGQEAGQFTVVRAVPSRVCAELC